MLVSVRKTKKGMRPRGLFPDTHPRMELNNPTQERLATRLAASVARRERRRGRRQAAQQVVVALVHEQLDRAILPYRLDDVARMILALQQALRQRILDEVLDRAAQRTRAIERVVALGHQEILGLVARQQLDLLLGELIAHAR